MRIGLMGGNVWDFEIMRRVDITKIVTHLVASVESHHNTTAKVCDDVVMLSQSTQADQANFLTIDL